MEAKVISKENLEKINELNQILENYVTEDKIACLELASNPEVGVKLRLPEINENSDSCTFEFKFNFTEEDNSYKELVKELNNNIAKVLKNFRDNLMFDIIEDIKEQIPCKYFDATMVEDTIIITIKL